GNAAAKVIIKIHERTGVGVENSVIDGYFLTQKMLFQGIMDIGFAYFKRIETTLKDIGSTVGVVFRMKPGHITVGMSGKFLNGLLKQIKRRMFFNSCNNLLLEVDTAQSIIRILAQRLRKPAISRAYLHISPLFPDNIGKGRIAGMPEAPGLIILWAKVGIDDEHFTVSQRRVKHMPGQRKSRSPGTGNDIIVVLVAP